jgi:hypothetical protein
MQTSDTYIRSNEVVTRVIGGELLIVPVRGKVGDLASIYSLNGVGTALWEALAKPVKVEDLAQLIVRQYDVPWDRAHGDLEQFLTEMSSLGLVSTEGAATNERKASDGRHEHDEE